MKKYTLLDIYKINLKGLVVTALIGVPVMLIFGIVVLANYPFIWWVGLILFGIAGLVAFVSILVGKSLKKRIKAIEEDEKNRRNGADM